MRLDRPPARRSAFKGAHLSAPERSTRRARLGDGFGGARQRAVVLGGSLGERGERHLIGARGQGHAPVQHRAEEPGVEPGGGRCRRSVVVRTSGSPSGTKKMPRSGPATGHPCGEWPTRSVGGAGRGQRAGQDLAQRRPEREHRCGQAGVGLGRRRRRARCDPPRWRAGSPTASRLVHGTERGQHGQHVLGTAEGADRQPPADHLSEAPQVGPHPGQRGRSALAEAEPGDHLVEHQQCACRVTGCPQPLEEARRRRDESHVGGHRLDDDACHPVVELGHHVVGDDHGVGHRGGRHARRIGKPEGGHAAAPSGQQSVGVTVVAAGELDDPVPAREPTGHPDRHSWPPRCPTTPVGPARIRAPGRRWPRPAGPRPRSAHRRWSPDRPPRARRRPRPDGRGRGSRRRRTGRSRAAGCRRRPTRRRPRPGPRSRDGRRPSGTSAPGELTPPGMTRQARSNSASEAAAAAGRRVSHRAPRPARRRSRSARSRRRPA